MERKLTGLIIVYLAFSITCFSQIDTTYIYKNSTPYGSLDIRIAKSPTNYYHLVDGTFSFRESAPGVRTNTFFDMTAWDSSPYREGHMREKTASGDNFIMNYRLLMPDNYNAGYDPGYPIVIMFHGYGERGNCELDSCYWGDRTWSPVTNTPAAPTNPDNILMNNDHNLLHGGIQHLAAVHKAKGKLPDDESLDARAFPGFVLFPQNLNGWDQFAVQDAIRVLRLVIKKYNIDEDRVYVEGLSNGGHGVYEALKRAPWLFTSAIAMSAIDDGFINAQNVAASIAHIPLWLFQGGMDQNPWPSKTMRYMQQFRAVGADVRYTLYPQLGHGTWNTAFAEPDFFSWMLGTNKSDIHSFQGSTFICSEEGTRLELAKGFPAYQWEFNGQVIPGADSAVFYAKSPGKYRARFSRVANPNGGQWNQWSKPIDLKDAPPPVASIQQIGTVKLRDLNGSNTAMLQSSDDHGRYYWYKDSKLLNLPGNQDDTLKAVTLPANFGNGAYTLAVADFGCLSDPSAPVHIFYNNSAPMNITAPTNVAGVSYSPAENTITWKDASSNEGGFEIWRRRKINNGTTWGPWEMSGLAPANATSFDDTAVEPTASYQYKVRAVSSTGRSEYTPSGSNTGVVVETVVDKEPPVAPTALKVKQRGVERFQLTWSPSTDNTRIREYIITYGDASVATGSPDTTFMLTGLSVNKEYDITVRGVDLSRNLSPESNKVGVSTYFSGLFYEHTTGSWTTLDSVDWSWAEFTGKVTHFTLRPKTQEDYYNFSYDGYVLITKAGNYQFRVTSSDGTRLWVEGRRLVNNDGIHDVKSVIGSPISLSKGPHRIYAQYFEYTQKDSLTVEYKGPDTNNDWATLTTDVLKSDPDIVTGIGDPDNGPEDSFVVSVYPNPTTQDAIHVMVQTLMPAPLRVRLLDLTGSNLFEAIFQPEELSSGVNVTPQGNLDAGMYLVTVEQGGITVRQKVIIGR